MIARKSIPISVVLILVSTLLAHGADPLEAVKGPIENVITILKDPQYQDSAQKTLQREKIWDIITQVFDFRQIGQLAVARDWKKFSPQEQDDFTDVFAKLLGGSYLDRIQKEFHDETVVFENADMVTDSKAVVKSRITRQAGDIPVDYKLFLNKGVWRVYDVNIEGISLVKNYRTQFQTILSKDTPAQLIDRLKRKIEQKDQEVSSVDAFRLGLALGLIFPGEAYQSHRRYQLGS